MVSIGGADMPVVISYMVYSGWAGRHWVTLENTALIITGALVGSSVQFCHT